MSDNEYDMEWEGSQNEDGWGDDPDAGSNNGSDDPQIQIENNFYEAEGMWKDEPQDALERFEVVIMLEESRPEKSFTFNSLKYMILLCAKLG